MQLVGNAQTLRHFLQRVKVAMHDRFYTSFPWVLLQAQQGKLTCTAFHARLHVAVTLARDLTIETEGESVLNYYDLVHALRSMSGLISLWAQDLSVLLRQEGEYPRQFRLDRKTAGQFPAFSPLVDAALGATWTRKETVQEECAACHQRTGSREVIQVYQVTELETQRVRLPKGQLLSLLEEVQWAANPPEDARHTGIALEIGSQRISLAATDGFRLAWSTREAAGTGNWPRAVHVPARAFITGARLVPDEDAVLVEAVFTHSTLSQENGQQEEEPAPALVKPALLRLTAGTCVVTIPLLSEDIPLYRSVLSQECVTRVVCETGALRQAVQAVAPLSEADQLRLFCDVGRIRIEAMSHAKDRTPTFYTIPIVDQTGPAASVVLDGAYVADVLRHIDTPHLSFDYCGTAKPVMLRPYGGRKESCFAVMPIKH